MSEFPGIVRKHDRDWYFVKEYPNRYGLYETIVENGIKLRECWDEFDLGMKPKVRPQSYKLDCKIEKKNTPRHIENIIYNIKRPSEKLIINYDLSKKEEKKIVYVKYNTSRMPIKEYESVYEASEDNDIPVERIEKACENNMKTKRFFWKKVLK